MRRRDFITAVAGSAIAWPLTAHAQQAAMPVVGFLFATSAAASSVGDVWKGLNETGFVEGRNVLSETRANDDSSRLPELAADLVKRQVSVIYAGGGAVAARAAQAATSTIPIVFSMGADPVATGLVTSLNRPGGNITGTAFLSNELGAKRLSLLHELVPQASRYAALVNPDAPGTDALLAELRAAAASMGKQIEIFTASKVGEIDPAFVALVERGAEALVVGSSSLLNGQGVKLAALAADHRLPVIYYDRRIVEVGGLMSYGASIPEAQREAGVYIGRILKGAKPADLPVTQMTKFDFVVNLKTAKALGLTIPQTLLATADEVIE